ncbi:MAG TPA: stage II sporulation protein M [Longimicrobiaceae bacterium]|jgi:uncharacterized membrane protein SpoIIM required for sporulation/uncharacterized RDD family membrane protein YckC|nr:stage II sporulation protein M [Longimicrobiaceae bacterium]
MQATSRASTLTDREVEVETPEHVAIGYELAGLGSRFAALLLDWLLLLGGLLVLGIGLPLIASLVGLGGIAKALGTAFVIGAVFVWTWGYFFYFEGFRDGQTPGKKRMGIRVVHDGGYPVTARGAAIRTLLRLVDMQPVPSWLIGGTMMMFHPRTKRLGDLVAGTVVVRERGGTVLPEEAAAAASLGPPRLSAEEFAWLGSYVARRAGLERDVRARIARQQAERLGPRFADDARRLHSSHDDFLVLVHADEAGRRAAAGLSGRSGSAQAAALFRRQRPAWDEYAGLLAKARDRGLDALPESQVSRFAALYREVAADLARARTYGASPELLYMLERTVGAGHNLLYRPPRRSWRALKQWLTGGFPALVRMRWRALALASALFYVPGVITYTALRVRPDLQREVVSPVLIARAEEAAEKEKAGKGYVELSDLQMPSMAVGIAANNVQVTFATFAGGILLGLGTVASLVYNGVSLGGGLAVFANVGHAWQILAFVIGHGAIELTAICIAGAAGLLLASAIVLPGRRTRREMLVIRGREAISLIGGTMMMLLIAGSIEGFVSPSHLPLEVKIGFASLMALLLLIYLLFAGRDEETRRAVEKMGRLA